MTPDALLYIMTGAVIVAAAALVLQAALMLALYKASKGIQAQVTVIAVRTESLAQSAHKTMEQTRKQLGEVAARSTEVLDLAHRQLLNVEAVLGEVTGRARMQINRVELVLDDAVARINDAVALLNNGVVRPVRELAAVVTGVRAAMQYFFRRNRLTVERAASDEEMFI